MGNVSRNPIVPPHTYIYIMYIARNIVMCVALNAWKFRMYMFLVVRPFQLAFLFLVPRPHQFSSVLEFGNCAPIVWRAVCVKTNFYLATCSSKRSDEPRRTIVSTIIIIEFLSNRLPACMEGTIPYQKQECKLEWPNLESTWKRNFSSLTNLK